MRGDEARGDGCLGSDNRHGTLAISYFVNGLREPFARATPKQADKDGVSLFGSCAREWLSKAVDEVGNSKSPVTIVGAQTAITSCLIAPHPSPAQ